MVSLKTKWNKFVAILIFFILMKITGFLCKDRMAFGQWYNIATVQSIHCLNHDPSFNTFLNCSLKPINRTLKYINVRAKLLTTSAFNITLGFRMLKRTASGAYKPFVIAVTLDLCKYLNGKKNPVFDWFYKMLRPFTNVNHSCPIKDEIRVTNFPCNQIIFPSILPNGEYRIEVESICNNVARSTTHVFLTLEEISKRNEIVL